MRGQRRSPPEEKITAKKIAARIGTQTPEGGFRLSPRPADLDAKLQIRIARDLSVPVG
jgi:hypothetical protein